MNFRVSIESSASTEIEVAYRWIERRSPLNAIRWYNRLIDALESLQRFPNRCTLAPESRYFREEIRQFLYGRGQRRYRALFLVHGDTVHVLHFCTGIQ